MTPARGGAIVALAIAFSTPAVPAAARTFDFNPHGSVVLQPLPPRFACAMKRATLNRHIACQAMHRPGRHAGQTGTT
jgi:hypothetical protein